MTNRLYDDSNAYCRVESIFLKLAKTDAVDLSSAYGLLHLIKCIKGSAIMLALSTSWKSTRVQDGRTLIQTLENLDISGVELDYRINDAKFQQMWKALKRSPLKVVSIHNYFPIPSSRSDSPGSGDLFLLSHPDKKQRDLAIEWTIRSIEYAGELGAVALVLHCGYVDMNPELDRLYHYLKSNQIHSKEAQVFISKKLKERERKKLKHLEGLRFSLERLARVAEKQNVLLGLENRYHYHELPGIEEFDFLFSEFTNTPIGYWHDTGHAHTNEILTITPPETFLKRYSDKLIGMHLHDALGLEDHLAPGSGEIDFDKIKSHLGSDILSVIELKPETPDSEVLQGIRFLRQIGFR